MIGAYGTLLGVIASSRRNSDPLYGNVVLLLNMNGANASTTFLDTSQYEATVTAAGNAKLSTSVKKFGSASGEFDGTGDYLTVGDAPRFNFGSDDFAVEAWIYPTSLNSSEKKIIQKGGDSLPSQFGFSFAVTSTYIRFLMGANGTTFAGGNGTVNVQTNEWSHIAASKQGNFIRIFHNGTRLREIDIGSANVATTTTAVIAVGSDNLGTSEFVGYIDSLRITSGAARYTDSFSAPTVEFPES